MKKTTTLFMFLVAFNMSAQDTAMLSASDSTNRESFRYTVGQIAYLQSFKNEAEIQPALDDDYEMFEVAIVDETLKSEINFSIYPNPTDDFLNIVTDFDLEEPLKYQIVTITAEMRLDGKLTGKTSEILTKNLIPGTYFLQIFQNERTIRTLGIIKK